MVPGQMRLKRRVVRSKSAEVSRKCSARRQMDVRSRLLLTLFWFPFLFRSAAGATAQEGGRREGNHHRNVGAHVCRSEGRPGEASPGRPGGSTSEPAWKRDKVTTGIQLRHRMLLSISDMRAGCLDNEPSSPAGCWVIKVLASPNFPAHQWETDFIRTH